MAIFLLVRHGQNDWVDKKRLAGWTPGVHLNDEGKRQVELLAERLNSLPVKAIYSSPLVRCTETADIIARQRGLEVQINESIGEVRYGSWEGKKLKKLTKKKRKWSAIQHSPSRFQFPGGESFMAVQARAVSAIEDLYQKHTKEVVLVVSHADVIKLLISYYSGTHIDLFQRFVISPASMSVLAFGKSGSVKILRVNDNGSLKIPENKVEDKEEPESLSAHDPESNS
jgi:probable phosphoglycerate mutase